MGNVMEMSTRTQMTTIDDDSASVTGTPNAARVGWSDDGAEPIKVSLLYFLVTFWSIGLGVRSQGRRIAHLGSDSF